MKNILLFIAIALTSCTNNPQTALTTPRLSRSDSIAAVIKKQHTDSVAAQYADSLRVVEKIRMDKFYRTKAGKIFKKHPTWSISDCEGVANKNLWIGMHIDMVYEIYGKPDDINTSNYGNGNQYQFCWHDWDPGFFYTNADYLVKSYN